MKEYNATPNFKNKTFTIKEYIYSSLIRKYKTVKLDDFLFESFLKNSSNDWSIFIQHETTMYEILPKK